MLASTLALVFFFTFLQTYQWQQRINAENSFAQMIIDAKLAHTSEPVIKPKEGRVYFHEARISVPLTAKADGLLYDYYAQSKDPDDSVGTMRILSQQAVHAIDLQETLCTKLAVVSFGERQVPGPHYAKPVTVSLADGRTMYVYANNSDDCSSEAFFRGGLGPDVAVKLLKQAESY